MWTNTLETPKFSSDFLNKIKCAYAVLGYTQYRCIELLEQTRGGINIVSVFLDTEPGRIRFSLHS